MVNRTADRAVAVGRRSPASVGSVVDADDARRPDLVVNATSVGHGRRHRRCRWTRPRARRRARSWPTSSTTRSARRSWTAAAAPGRPPVDGLGMLVGQAAVAFERWTGAAAARAAMRAARRPRGELAPAAGAESPRRMLGGFRS